MSQRIKGQEVEVLVVLNGQTQDALFDVRSLELVLQQEITSEGYLGETTNRKDSIFNGVRGRLEAHFENNQFVTLFTAVVNKSRRREAGTRINIKTTLNFPNGQRVRVMIPDVEFGDLPINFGSRSDFGTIGLDFEAAELNFL